MAWVYLFIAGLLECVWGVGLKYTDGFTRLKPSVIVIGAMAASMYLFALALRTLPIGIAYAVWVSIGIIGAALAQPILFKQSLSLPQLGFLAMLLVAIVGLKMTSSVAK
jgi:quaternary ammonium compound-resistance protein SugE